MLRRNRAMAALSRGADVFSGGYAADHDTAEDRKRAVAARIGANFAARRHLQEFRIKKLVMVKLSSRDYMPVSFGVEKPSRDWLKALHWATVQRANPSQSL